MASNTLPLFTLTPNISVGQIPYNNAVVRNDGTSTTGGTAAMVLVFTSGTTGSYLDRIRIYATATSAAATANATTVRIFLSTVANPGSTNTTPSDTFLLVEVSLPVMTSTVSHSTSAENYYEVPIGMMIPASRYIHACQHLAQPSGTIINVMAIGGNY